jgi:trehalose 6-phosphate synthase
MPSRTQFLGEYPAGGVLANGLGDGGDGRNLILVSNRGPIEHTFGPDGIPQAIRGAGGVVSGLLCAIGQGPVTWIALAMTDADRAMARTRGKATIQGSDDLENIALRLVDVPQATYSRYYDGISNRILWFAQHYLLQPTAPRQFSERTRKDWEQGYSAVNEAVAEAVLAELEVQGTATPVLFQDYHLYLAPAHVRAARPDAQLAHFIHIPWPESRYWELMPEDMVRAVFRGLASNDLIGFQTHRDVRNFLEGAQRFLEGATPVLDERGDMVALDWQGRRVLVQAYPIAVTPTEVLASAEQDDAAAAADDLCQELDDEMRLIVRVDRVEPTKNIVRGFQAYERLLRDHADLRGKVTFLALLVPSRLGMREYQTYERQIRRQVERINARFGRPGWQPIVAIFGNDRARALACMRRFDVLLVNPVIDGMNLVVKEGVLVNERNGVVVLSRTAGAFEQLGEHALGIPPLDVWATAEALHQALTMAGEERHTRASAMKRILHGEDAYQWLMSQLADLERHLRVMRLARRPAVAQLRHRVIPADVADDSLRSLAEAHAALHDAGDEVAISM